MENCKSIQFLENNNIQFMEKSKIIQYIENLRLFSLRKKVMGISIYWIFHKQVKVRLSNCRKHCDFPAYENLRSFTFCKENKVTKFLVKVSLLK